MKGFFVACAFIFVSAGPVWAEKKQVDNKGRIDILEERAQRFQKLGLLTLARLQYDHLLSLDKKNKSYSEAKESLAYQEGDLYFAQAKKAHANGAAALASLSCQRALEANPKLRAAKKLLNQIRIDQAFQASIKETVDRDYQKGLTYYQQKKYDRALEYFVKVLNMNPTHKGAMIHLQRLGQAINEPQKN